MGVYDDILELIEYTPYSNYVATYCPFDEHASPALMIYVDEDKPDGEGRYYCLSCSKGGTHAYLYKFLTGKSIAVVPGAKKVQKFLPQWKRWEERYGSIEALVQKAHENVTNFPSTHAWYLKKRDLMPMYEKCKLGYIEDWLIFPILDPQGKVLDVIARDSKGRSKYVIHSNDEDTPLLYVPNWARVMSSKRVFIVYGLIDAIALEMCGLPVLTGSTGKSLSNKRLIQMNKRYIIIPDKDEDEAARKLAKSLGNFTHIIRLPWSELEGCKDSDDIRMKFGLDKLKETIINLL